MFPPLHLENKWQLLQTQSGSGCCKRLFLKHAMLPASLRLQVACSVLPSCSGSKVQCIQPAVNKYHLLLATKTCQKIHY